MIKRGNMMKKRKWILMAAGILMSGGAAFAGSALSEGTGSLRAYAQAVAAFDAKAYVEALCTGDAAELESSYTYTDEMSAALAQGGGLGALQSSIASLGGLKEAEEAVSEEASGYTSYRVPCRFEVQNVDIVINTDAQGRIAGIVTMPYTGSQSADGAGGSEEAALPEGIEEISLSVPVKGTEGWELSGTLTLPEGDGPFPAVVLVHGSGPNDRDESIGPNKPFRDIAWALAQQGIAVYRYDKRTYVYGAELASDTELTLNEETVEDGVQAAVTVKAQEKIDPSRVYVLGHSLGGEALPRISAALASDGEEAAGYIFLAAPARSLIALMREQYDFLYSLMPELDEAQEKEKEQVYQELDKLSDPDALAEDEIVMGAYKKYWQDLESYDPVAAAADMNGKCLVLQGEEDYQVTMEDFALWEDAYFENENWEFITYPGLTHLFMAGEKANGSADYMTAQNVDPQVTWDIAAFINGKNPLERE